jgi:hypothetical protein
MRMQQRREWQHTQQEQQQLVHQYEAPAAQGSSKKRKRGAFSVHLVAAPHPVEEGGTP